MTERERLEQRLETVTDVISYLQQQLTKYCKEDQQLNMELNRARRLEREAKELQS